ncbi:subclass B3 metallo-beta-lactamase [Brevifollis gellanilyticus]|uniref:beta-lactamase n=1 Tax=Brevifollis gellanilyticus TaxID=748831 RepID=A0A512MHB2_9BACT|nr:subclass B3 metallo-beta-lactamase [Brevifollis gellanilyticus]GEP46127.1 subclass B3 metallo-beta-lactamase BJP-1 [Brevifollis gellanilyticus]
MKPVLFLFSLLVSLTFTLSAQAQRSAAWTTPFPPHKIAGNLYYVGSQDLASYLVTTPEGHILINSSLEESVPLIRDAVTKLGFKWTDIKILLISHAHDDHCGGSATILKETGAKHFVMEGDADAIESGGVKKTRLSASYMSFAPAKVDRRLKDGEEVTLGGSTLVAHLTPGHTPGCTTWTMKVDGLDAVIIGSPNVNPGTVLVNSKTYPAIAEDYKTCFRVLKALPIDIFLGAHGGYYDLQAKHAKLATAGGNNPFFDKAGYAAYVADREQAFLKELAKQMGK